MKTLTKYFLSLTILFSLLAFANEINSLQSQKAPVGEGQSITLDGRAPVNDPRR